MPFEYSTDKITRKVYSVTFKNGNALKGEWIDIPVTALSTDFVKAPTTRLNIDWTIIKGSFSGSQSAIKNPQSSMSTPTYTILGDLITETKTGYIGQVTKNANGYAVHLLKGPDDSKKSGNLIKRMRNWYVYSHLKDK